jgi:hypothetical protein
MPKPIEDDWSVDVVKVPKGQAEKLSNDAVAPPNRDQDRILELQITSETDYLPFEEEDS